MRMHSPRLPGIPGMTYFNNRSRLKREVASSSLLLTSGDFPLATGWEISMGDAAPTWQRVVVVDNKPVLLTAPGYAPSMLQQAKEN